MDVAYWDAIASAVSTYIEMQQPERIPCKVRLNYKIRNLPLLAFVGSTSALPCADFICELEAQGYLVIGHGMSANESHWGVIFEPRTDQDWTDCVKCEVASIR